MKTRTFAQIIQDEKNQRNIIEIQLNRIFTNDSDPKSLTYEDIGELLFDFLQINPDDCISFNFNTGRYDQREVKFKANMNTSQFLRVEPITFKEHTITVKKQRQNIIRVTFKNDPLNVPDEEILTLCAAYGKAVDGCVQYERLNNIKGRGLTGSTRYVDMELEPGQTFENLYWMEGPLQGNVGKRIVVLYSGQARNTYMQSLRDTIGYVSMKIRYAENQAKIFPSLIGLPGEKSSEQELQSLWNMEEGENTVEGGFTTILTPVEEKDKIISCTAIPS